ncbi:MAG: AAA family ATPase [Thaumarchaeota archaeon]|nr:AAA family ATPase [Nitrososphaerota archaeon]
MRIITGTPGTGKHTIARRVARELGLHLVDVNEVAKTCGLAKRKGGALEVDVVKLSNMIKRKIPQASLLVGHLAPYVVSKRNVESCIVLRRSPYKLERSYRARGYSRKKALENLGSEILGTIYYDAVKNFGRKKVLQLDTTNLTVPDTVKKARSLLAGRRTGSKDVDWLKIISKKGDLRRFFPY